MTALGLHASKDPAQLWFRYCTALILILTLVTASYILALDRLRAADDDAAMVNISGRQRMLSQRIVLFSALIDRDRTTANERALEDAIHQFEQGHRFLTHVPKLPDRVRTLFFGGEGIAPLAPEIDAFIADARLVLSEEPGARAALDRVQAVGPRGLLERLDAVVIAFERDAARKKKRLANLHAWTFVASILMLVLEVVFIFLPAHRATVAAFSKVSRSNDELEKVLADIELQSMLDPLTGLGNRRFLETSLERLARMAARQNLSLAVLHIDLDRFKQINDTMGHAAGDFVLSHVGDLIVEVGAPGDVLARVGGDEFVLARIGRFEPGALEALAQALIGRMGEPLLFEGKECRFGASIGIGIAIGNTHPVDTQKLLVDADIALYRAKEQGRGGFEFFCTEMEQEIRRNKKVFDAILIALEEEQFEPFYQPQVDARTQEVIGFEVLARWRHPQEGLLAPDSFIRIARDMNVLSQIDTRMLAQAIEDRRNWERNGAAPMRLAFNATLEGLTDGSLLDALETMTDYRRLVSFELTEAIFFDEGDARLLEAVRRLKDMGFGIEIDDFGTGHASIVSLLTIRPDRLKIDQQLIKPIVGSPSWRALVSSIIEIGRSMDVEVIAEGVETLEHARILADLGCDALQGHAFSPALNAVDAGVFVGAQPGRKAS